MKTDTPVSRAVSLLFILQGHSYHGLRLAQITEKAQAQKTTVLRNLQSLEAAGAVERVPGDGSSWRLSPRIVQLAIAHYDEQEKQRRLQRDFETNYSRTL